MRHVRLQETGTGTFITLLEPTRDRVSTANAVTDVVEVRLRRPVGDRLLFDRGRPRLKHGARLDRGITRSGDGAGVRRLRPVGD